MTKVTWKERISAIEPSQSITIPIEELDVTLLQKGEKIKKSSTGDNGKFTLEDVEPGVYTLVASGRSGFLAYGVHVLPKLEKVDGLNLNAQIDDDSRSRYYVSLGVPKGVKVQDQLQIDAAAIPPEFSTLERISDNYLPAANALSVGQDKDDTKAIAKRPRSQADSSFRFLTTEVSMVEFNLSLRRMANPQNCPK